MMTKQQIAYNFIRESNMIERIIRPADPREIEMFVLFMELPTVTVADMVNAVNVFQTCSDLPHAGLRQRPGMNVQVRDHLPPRGGEHVLHALDTLLYKAAKTDDAHGIHVEYETLHPFMDGNGRSGRLLWAWMMYRKQGWSGLSLKFLHLFYYQTLGKSR